MTSVTGSNRYQPLIVPSDPLVRRPIAPWRALLLQGLRKTLAMDDIDVPQLVVILNQLALLEAYRGNTDAALAMCDAQIRFWHADAAARGAPSHLWAVVQPWINIVRLERWNGNLAPSMALYQELGPARRQQPGSLQKRYDIGLTLDALTGLDRSAGIAIVLDVAYWREYGNLLFGTGQDEALRQHLQGGMRQGNDFLRVAMLELLLVHQVNLGKHDAALSVLRRLPLDPSMTHWLPFKTLEMCVARHVGDPGFAALADAVLAGALALAHAGCDQRGLLQLVQTAQVFERLGMHADESMLLRAARDIAGRLDDEVVSFDIQQRLCALGHEDARGLRARFSTSGYALIRKKLGLRPAAADGPDIVAALRAYADLDVDACLDLLDGAPARSAAACAV